MNIFTPLGYGMQGGTPVITNWIVRDTNGQLSAGATAANLIDLARAAGVDEQRVADETERGYPTLDYFAALSPAEFGRALCGLVDARRCAR